MTKPITNLLAASMLAIGLAACADQPRHEDRAYYNNGGAVEYGRVSSIEVIGTDGTRHTSGAGAVVGGIVGGVLGHQVGNGRGNDVATVAGAVGGAVVGNEIEKNRNAENGGVDRYRISVRLDNGGSTTYDQDGIGDLRVGDRVRVDSGRVSRY